MAKKIHSHYHHVDTQHIPNRPKLQPHQTQRAATPSQSRSRAERTGASGSEARRHTIQRRSVWFSLLSRRQLNGIGVIGHSLSGREAQMAHYTNVVLGFIAKLQSHIFGGTLPQRPHSGLGIGGLLGACALEGRTVASEFKKQNSEFMILLAVLSSKKKISFSEQHFFNKYVL